MDSGSDRLRLGLALGGGGARGLAHIGVLGAFEDEGFEIDVITGTSVGSLVGALTAAGLGSRDIESIARDIEWTDLVGLTLPKVGLVRTEKMERLIDDIVGAGTIEELDIPFAAVATDITTAEPVIFTRGPVASAVRASCSVPVVFEPTEVDGRVLVDGGLVNEVPGDMARKLGADIVVAVNLNADRKNNEPPQNLIDVLFYSLNILIAGTSQAGRIDADVTLEPELKGFGYAELKRIDELIQRGREAAENRIEDIRRLLRREGPGS